MNFTYWGRGNVLTCNGKKYVTPKFDIYTKNFPIDVSSLSYIIITANLINQPKNQNFLLFFFSNRQEICVALDYKRLYFCLYGLKCIKTHIKMKEHITFVKTVSIVDM